MALGRISCCCCWSLLSLALVWSSIAVAANWLKLEQDGLHDSGGQAVKLLQDPSEAMSQLPPDTAGNKVDWIRALQGGYIKPRSALRGEKEYEILDQDVFLNIGGSTPAVLFPHKAHTEWLDCENCHERLFRSKTGETPITMEKILQGEYCGVCHGAVAFPLTECDRCHSVPQSAVEQRTSTAP